MQWQEFKRIVEEELGITNQTEVWKIDVNLPVASEFLYVERDTLLGTSITAEELHHTASEQKSKQKKSPEQPVSLLSSGTDIPAVGPAENTFASSQAA